MSVRLDFESTACGALTGEITVPGDKSISHRCVMLGSLADGVSEISGFLDGADCRATARAFEQMGVTIEHDEPTRLRIHGRGVDGLESPEKTIDLGNSGTSMRLLAGLLAAQLFDTTLTGDASLTRRPMNRVITPLTRMGAIIQSNDDGTAPLVIKGGRVLQAIDYPLPLASAQVKSAILLAGLYADGTTRVEEPATTRDHTERLLKEFGYPVSQSGPAVALEGGHRLSPASLRVPGDISSAAFFIVAASIIPGSDITLRHVGVNPTRTGILDILRLMGAHLEVTPESHSAAEPAASIRVRSAPLKGIRVPAHLVPLAIDEFPVILIAAACAEGETVVTGAEELRVKESDRIDAMATGLNQLGIDARGTADGIVIQGGRLTGGTVSSFHDHRIAMAFAVAGACSREPVVIEGCGNVGTSYPDFQQHAETLGMNIRVRDD